ncbi:hypothetical protein SAMN04244553_5623 [Nocardia amikacinitolerans]|uniref:Uncharacterized protein n=1 Tax=Nocardia amikacinitolerans TaxID=756689 RepID=A0A285LUQ4_9NOCA|nr:hypothetical protein SAMN04244553_5623 [Nocardia amikacinitolerans]
MRWLLREGWVGGRSRTAVQWAHELTIGGSGRAPGGLIEGGACGLGRPTFRQGLAHLGTSSDRLAADQVERKPLIDPTA